MKSKLEFAHKSCETPSSTKRPFFKLHLPIRAETILGIGLALGLGAPMVTPTALRAQDAMTNATSPQNQAKVQYIPLTNIKQSVADADTKYKIATVSLGVSYSVILSDSTEVTLGFHLSSGEPAIAGEAGDVVFVSIWRGQALKPYDISLSELKTAYKHFSGKELKYVRVGAKICRDAAGEYAEFAIVPVASKDGEIAPGTPIGRVQGSLDGVGSKGCEDTAKVLLSLK